MNDREVEKLLEGIKVSVARNFSIQRTRLEFRFEVFNLLNRTI